MGELALGAVHLGPLVVNGNDLRHLLVEQAVHGRSPGPPVLELAVAPPCCPSVGPDLAQLELPARSSPAPAFGRGPLEQVQ